MATAASVTTDLTTCPICKDLFDNPKSLPCLHAFCLKCLEGCFGDKSPGKHVPCPVCREKFKIPPSGLFALKHHFFVQQLVDARKAEAAEAVDEAPCEVCIKENEGSSERISRATSYCIDCRQKLCERCSMPHRWMKDGAHQVRPLGAELEQELIQLRGSYCDKHKNKQVELYCLDCSENICLMCSAVKHRNHNSGEIAEVASNFRVRADEDDQQILSVINAIREQSEQTQQDVAESISEAENVKKTVLAIGDVIKRSVDNQISLVLKEVDSVMSESAKQAHSAQESYQLALVTLESFHAYSRELIEKGRPSDITRAAGELHDRATELISSDVTPPRYRPPHLTFTPADVTQVKDLNLIGKLSITADNQSEVQQPKQASDRASQLQEQLIQAADRERQLQQQLNKMKDDVTQLQMQRADLQREFDDFKQHVIRLWEPDMGHVIQRLHTAGPVWGVTSLDNHLYVLRGAKTSEQVEVYDKDSYRLVRCLTVPGLCNSGDIVACSYNHCAYISDWSHNYIRRIALPAGDDVTHWPVNDAPVSLSLTVTHSVLVTCLRGRKIKEINTGGHLLRVVVLADDVVTPLHTIQLSSGEFIVCNGSRDDPVHRVCLVGTDGEVVKSFSGPPGSGSQQMNVPVHMAVDRYGFVFVADLNNCRVLLLSPALTFVREVVSRDQLQWRPWRLHLDEARRRLYVADGKVKDGKHTAGRVIVVNV